MDRKTVFVIGAGASKEANLPTGLELKIQLLNYLIFASLMDITKKAETTLSVKLYASLLGIKMVKMAILIPICMKLGT